MEDFGAAAGVGVGAGVGVDAGAGAGFAQADRTRTRDSVNTKTIKTNLFANIFPPSWGSPPHFDCSRG